MIKQLREDYQTRGILGYRTEYSTARRLQSDSRGLSQKEDPCRIELLGGVDGNSENCGMRMDLWRKEPVDDVRIMRSANS